MKPIFVLFVSLFVAHAAQAANGRKIATAALGHGSTLILSAVNGGKLATQMAKGCGPHFGCWAVVGVTVAQVVLEVRGARDANQTCREAGTCLGTPPRYTCADSGSCPIATCEEMHTCADPNDPNGNLYNNPFNPRTPHGQVNLTNGINKDLANLKNDLAENGITLNPDGSLTTPKGTFSSAQMKSAAGLAAMGVTAKDLQEAEKLSEAINAESERKYGKMLNVDGGYSGGGVGRMASNNNNDKELDAYLKGLLKNRKPAKEDLSGLSVMRNGEPIGIAQGNIFETITKRYDKLRQTGAVGLTK